MPPTARRRLLLVAGALVAAACGGDRASRSLPISLVDDPGIAHVGKFLAWGSSVTLGVDTREVISAVTPLRPQSEPTTGSDGYQSVRATIPSEVATVPWFIVETVAVRDGEGQLMRSWPSPGAKAGQTLDLPVVPARLVGATPEVVVWPNPDLETRDVETGDVVLPAHAALTVGAGLQPPSWNITVVPIDMTVAVVDGGQESVLRTVQLNPGSKESQRWVDVAAPLGDRAGHTVRFRFRARPSAGPTMVPAMPVWAEPTLIEALPPGS